MFHGGRWREGLVSGPEAVGGERRGALNARERERKEGSRGGKRAAGSLLCRSPHRWVGTSFFLDPSEPCDENADVGRKTGRVAVQVSFSHEPSRCTKVHCRHPRNKGLTIA